MQEERRGRAGGGVKEEDGREVEQRGRRFQCFLMKYMPDVKARGVAQVT